MNKTRLKNFNNKITIKKYIIRLTIIIITFTLVSCNKIPFINKQPLQLALAKVTNPQVGDNLTYQPTEPGEDVYKGMSGGAVLNEAGQLVGIHVGLTKVGGDGEGVLISTFLQMVPPEVEEVLGSSTPDVLSSSSSENEGVELQLPSKEEKVSMEDENKIGVELEEQLEKERRKREEIEQRVQELEVERNKQKNLKRQLEKERRQRQKVERRQQELEAELFKETEGQKQEGEGVIKKWFYRVKFGFWRKGEEIEQRVQELEQELQELEAELSKEKQRKQEGEGVIKKWFYQQYVNLQLTGEVIKKWFYQQYVNLKFGFLWAGEFLVGIWVIVVLVLVVIILILGSA